MKTVSSYIRCRMLKVATESLNLLNSRLDFRQILDLHSPARVVGGLSWLRRHGFSPGMAQGYLLGPISPAAIYLSQTAVSEYSYKAKIIVCLCGPTWCADIQI